MSRSTIDLAEGLGNAIKSMRLGAQLSQSELAERLGTTQPAVSRWERGHDEPRVSTFSAIARACGCVASITLDDGVDRGQIVEHLAMAPVDRLRSVANVSRLRSSARPKERT
jgi:transcriptional regulator with XRE-family HTH domain